MVWRLSEGWFPMKDQRICQELRAFLQHLIAESALPPDYRIDLQFEFDQASKHVGKVSACAVCNAQKDHARITMFGRYSLGARLEMLAHEFKHVLQTAVENCRLKKGGKAREAQADAFADRVTPPYILQRAEDGCELLYDYAELIHMLNLCPRS